MAPEPIDPATIHALAEFEAPARERMDPAGYDYVAGGAWDEQTLADNVEAWRRLRFRPRVLTDLREIDPQGSFLGRPSALPVAVAPMAVQAMAHPEGEVAAVRAAAAAGVPYCLSTTSSRTIEEVAAAAPDAERWFQLYLVQDLDFTRSLVERAAAAGFRAIVLTVDLPVFGYRQRDRRSGFALPPMGNLVDAPARPERGRYGPNSAYGAIEEQHAIGLTWRDLEEIRRWSDLPLVLKGILTREDARLAVDAGVDAIVVSNHGARQLDRSPATADVLEEVVAAANGRTEVWVDGGIRRGLDVVAAIALGARGVLVGRPIYWALAAAGESGVARAMAILREEIELALPLLGVASVGQLDRSHLR